MEVLDRAEGVRRLEGKTDEESVKARKALRLLVRIVGPKLFWEWCKCHQAHLACVDATGVNLQASKRSDAHSEAQELVLQLVTVINAIAKKANLKLAFEAAQQASVGKAQKLRSVVKQRWAAMATLLERVLIDLDAIKAACGKEDLPCPFGVKQTELVELYSLLKPIGLYITRSQASMAASGSPVCVAAQFELIGLRCGVLNEGRPLVILDPATAQPQEEEGGGKVERQHADLSSAAQQVRKLLAAGFDTRGLKAQYSDPRYRAQASDLAMFLYPPIAPKMEYVDKMAKLYGAGRSASELKVNVELKVQELVELAIIGQRAAEAEAAAAGNSAAAGGGASSSAQSSGGSRRSACFKPKAKTSASRFLDMGLVSVGGTGGARARGAAEERSPYDEAVDIIKAYVRQAEELDAAAFMREYPPDHVHLWWKKQPEGPLKVVARAVLGQAASSAPLENAFSTGADIAVRRRSSLAPHRVEMLLVCMLMGRVVKLTPDDVKEIPAEEVEEQLPGRFTRAALITNLKAFGAEVLAEEDERAAAAGQEQQRELTGEEEMDMLQGWSSLADFASLDVDGIAEWEAFWAPTREGNGN